MKKLDLYIIRKFLATFFFTVILFSIVASVIDLTEKIDALIEHSVPAWEVISGYYLNFVPYIDALLSPLFIFISVIFFTSRMAYNTEIIAILASGISFYRLLVPYLVTALFLACLLLAGNHYFVPKANKGRLAFEFTYISNPYKRAKRHVYMQIKKNEYVYMENYNGKDRIGYKFSYEVFSNDELLNKLRADRIEWNEEDQKWILRNYQIREFDGLKENIVTGAKLDSAFAFMPNDFLKRTSMMQEMNSAELKEHINKMRLRGDPGIEFYVVELYRRTSDAFTVIILTLIGISLASRKVRGGSGLHIAFGVALSASFIIFTRFSTTFSTNGNLPPLVSVWIPNVFFGLLAIYLLRRAPK